MNTTFPNHELESLIDRFGARRVLSEFADIANGKAEHLQTNWQDKRAARNWSTLANKLGNLVEWTRKAVA